MRSPWAREYVRTSKAYIWGTESSPLAREASALLLDRGRVIDLGCGEGRDSVFFAAQGFEVTGVDVSAAGLRKAQRLARERGVAARWLQGDMARLRFEGPFDLVYSCGAIHYVPRRDRARLLVRLKACTRPDGYHAFIVFTGSAIYVEKGEVIDYFEPGELARAYADWVILRCAEGEIACAQDGVPHHHSVQEFVVKRPGAPGREEGDE